MAVSAVGCRETNRLARQRAQPTQAVTTIRHTAHRGPRPQRLAHRA